MAENLNEHFVKCNSDMRSAQTACSISIHRLSVVDHLNLNADLRISYKRG